MEFEELRKEHKIFAYHISPSYGVEGVRWAIKA